MYAEKPEGWDVNPFATGVIANKPLFFLPQRKRRKKTPIDNAIKTKIKRSKLRSASSNSGVL